MNVDFEPQYYAMHFNGRQHAAFLTANAALAFQRGEDSGYFHIVNRNGEQVVMHDQPTHPGHAYAILGKLER